MHRLNTVPDFLKKGVAIHQIFKKSNHIISLQTTVKLICFLLYRASRTLVRWGKFQKRICTQTDCTFHFEHKVRVLYCIVQHNNHRSNLTVNAPYKKMDVDVMY